MFRFVCIFLMALIVLVPQLCFAEQHIYRQTTGDKEVLLSWSLLAVDNSELTTTIGPELDVTYFDGDYATHRWTVDDPETQTRLEVRREENRLIFAGVFRGEALEKSVDIDDSPWYQALSYALRLYHEGEGERQEFWSVRPDTLDVYRMQVNLVGEEQLTIQGETIATLKLKIRLTGLRAKFWSSSYWLRKNDGVFVRYEGPSGPPGSPMTVVELHDDGASEVSARINRSQE